MTEDEADESPLITAIRSLGRQVAAEVQASARHVVVSLAVLAAMALVALVAAAVSIGIGMVFIARGVHTIIQLLIGIGWIADFATGIIFTALPLLMIAIARRRAQPHADPEPPTPPG
jgi:hypothetical protein